MRKLRHGRWTRGAVGLALLALALQALFVALHVPLPLKPLAAEPSLATALARSICTPARQAVLPDGEETPAAPRLQCPICTGQAPALALPADAAGCIIAAPACTTTLQLTALPDAAPDRPEARRAWARAPPRAVAPA